MKSVLYYKKIISIILTFVLSAGVVLANTISDALNAIDSGNNVEAVKIWSKLANNGNAIARYNLAVHYSNGNGVAKNINTSNQWLQKATRSGLVQAYVNLNGKAISSAKGMQLSFNSGPLHWLSEQDPNLYTIQLASSRKEKSIEKIYDENFLKDKGGYYHYDRNGVDRYALIYGTYKTVAEAKLAINKLPEKLRKTTPWVRKIKALQKISK